MTAMPSIDPAQFLNEQLSQASPDLMRDLLTTFVNALLSAQADAVCGAGYGERTPERVSAAARNCPETATKLPAGGHENCPLTVMGSARHDVVCLAVLRG